MKRKKLSITSVLAILLVYILFNHLNQYQPKIDLSPTPKHVTRQLDQDRQISGAELNTIGLPTNMRHEQIDNLILDIKSQLKLNSRDYFSQLIPVEVLRVIDGDTLLIKNPEAAGNIRLRLLGINVPESYANPDDRRQTPEGEAVSIISKAFLENKIIYLEYDEAKYDQYDRLLAYCWLDKDLMINEAWLKLGWCKAVKFEPNKKYYEYFKQLEREARKHHLGIWN